MNGTTRHTKYSFLLSCGKRTLGTRGFFSRATSPISDVVKLQNRAIRIINDVPILDNITPHYVNLSILKFPDIVKLHTCLFLYDHLCDAKPSNFRIPLLSDQHSGYTTRKVSSEQLYIPFFRTNIKRFCPTIIGRYFWNDLPASIRSRPTKFYRDIVPCTPMQASSNLNSQSFASHKFYPIMKKFRNHSELT